MNLVLVFFQAVKLNDQCERLKILWEIFDRACKVNSPIFRSIYGEGCQVARIRDKGHHKVGVLVLRDISRWIPAIMKLKRCCVFHLFVDENYILRFQNNMRFLVDLDFSLVATSPNHSVIAALNILPNSRFMLLYDYSKQARIFKHASLLLAHLSRHQNVPHLLLGQIHKDTNPHMSNVIVRKGDFSSSAIIMASKNYLVRASYLHTVSNMEKDIWSQMNGSLTWLLGAVPIAVTEELPSMRPCIQKKVIFVHEKLDVNSLEGGDFRIISLASRIAKLTCQKPVFSVRELLSAQRPAEAFLGDYGLALNVAGLKLEKAFPRPCQSPNFDLAIVGVWFWRENFKSAAELAFDWQSKNCITKLIGLTDDIHWIRMTQGLLVNAFSNVPVPRAAFETILEKREDELNLYSRLDGILTVNAADAHSIGHLVENGYERSCPVSHVEVSLAKDMRAFSSQYHRNSICFSGDAHLYNEFAMHWFLNFVFPRLMIDGVRLNIFGRRWKTEFCHRKGVICREKKDYNLCYICIAPTQIAFSGIVTKIGEYLEYKKKVISNYIGGHPFANNSNVVLVSSADQFAVQITRHLESTSGFTELEQGYIVDESLPPCLISWFDRTLPQPGRDFAG